MAAAAPSRPRPRPRAVPRIPFTGAAHEHVEPITTQTVTPGATAQNFGPFDVPAYGYLRHIFLEVTGTGGVAGAGVVTGDYPFNLFQNITLLDVNGTPLTTIDGFALLQCNIYGGYGGKSDPRLSPWYSASQATPAFFLRIPVEIARHNGLGALSNQNAAAAYKLQWTINTEAAMWSTNPSTVPTFTIKAQLEAWSLPNERDLAGRPQMQYPPAHGTSQYISYFTRTINTGNITYLLPRVGNLIRLILFIARNTNSGAPRDDTVFPNPFQFLWDARILTNETQNYRIQKMGECAHTVSSTRDTGVFALMYNNTGRSGLVGDEEPNLWLPTVQSSRLELDGVVANGSGGTIQTVTIDVAPVEVLPSERYVEDSASGFHPAGAGRGAGTIG